MPTDFLDDESTPPEQSLSGTVRVLGAVMRKLERALDLAAEDPIEDLDLAAEVMVELNLAKASLKESYERYEVEMATAMEARREELMEVDGGFTLERTQGSNRKKWDHRRLGKVVAERIIDASVDMDTGEILMTQEEQIMALLQYAAPSYWRVTQLKKLGISPNKYCEVEDGKISVVIRKPKG